MILRRGGERNGRQAKEGRGRGLLTIVSIISYQWHLNTCLVFVLVQQKASVKLEVPSAFWNRSLKLNSVYVARNGYT